LKKRKLTRPKPFIRVDQFYAFIRSGRVRQRYRAVKSHGPDNLAFQSVKTGAPIRDNMVLCRHIKPAARKLGIGWVNRQVLRRSCATWMDQAQVNVKDAQGLMRHSRASTTQNVYQQVVPESQRNSVKKLSAFVRQSTKEAVVVLVEVQPNARRSRSVSH